jgi:hypothetical protein
VIRERPAAVAAGSRDGRPAVAANDAVWAPAIAAGTGREPIVAGRARNSSFASADSTAAEAAGSRRVMKVSERFACRVTGRNEPPNAGRQQQRRQPTRMRKASTAECDSQRSKMLTRPGSTGRRRLRRQGSQLPGEPVRRCSHSPRGRTIAPGLDTESRNGPVPSTSDAQGGSARWLPDISGITCSLHPNE